MTRRTAKNPLPARGDVVKETGDAGASNTDAALEHSEPAKEVRHMSRCGYNGDSTPEINPTKCDTWKAIGALAAELARKAGGK